MVKISGSNSGAICGGVSNDVSLKKINTKQASAGNEIQYLAFIALKNITVGREHPPEPEKPYHPYPNPRYAIPDTIFPPKEPKPSVPKDPPCCACYKVPPPRDNPWDRKKPWEK